ncbi:MAG: sulfate transporter [Legionella sp. 40-6]|nr:MAG: sulfate transporter [Legionella sp. 40-6]
MNSIAFKPGNELTFRSVIALKKSIYQAITAAEGEVFILDLNEVRHCDSAGIALLIEVQKFCVQQNKKLEIIGMSSHTQSLADFCGVRDILEVI